MIRVLSRVSSVEGWGASFRGGEGASARCKHAQQAPPATPNFHRHTCSGQLCSLPSPPLSSRAYSRPMRSRSFPSLPARIRTCYDAFDDDGKKFVRREKLCPADRSIGRDGGRDESGLFLARGETIAPLLFIKTAKHRVSQVKRLL